MKIYIDNFSLSNITHIKPVHIKLQKDKGYDSKMLKWVNPKRNQTLGLPAPVLSMLVDLGNRKRVILNES